MFTQLSAADWWFSPCFSSLCSVCEKSLPRWLGKQAYECRNCQLKVHKQCHVRVETVCADSTVHTMEL